MTLPLSFSNCQYLLLIAPDNDVYEKIMAEKRAFAEKFDAPAILFAKPHITLLKFTQCEPAEKRIVRQLQQYADTVDPMDLRLQGFNNFPSNHTIYVNVTTQNDIVKLVRGMRRFQSLLWYDKNYKPHFIEKPHITLARRLQPWQFEKGWQEWQQKDFSGRFQAQSFVLLKRQDEKSPYRKVSEMAFLGQKKTCEQGSLFG